MKQQADEKSIGYVGEGHFSDPSDTWIFLHSLVASEIFILDGTANQYSDKNVDQ